VQSLEIADDTKKYITEKLNPILIELTQVLIRHTPRDIKRFILQWLKMLKDGGSKDLVIEHAKLLEELTKLQGENKAVSVIASTMNDTGGADAKDEESEEDDDDDMVDEIEIIPIKKAGGRQSVSAEAYGAWNQKQKFEPPVHAKDDAQKERIAGTMAKSFLFNALEGEDKDTVILAMEEVNAAADEVMIKQGDDGDFLFVIESGTLECILNKDGEDIVVKTCVAGDVFGELALLYNQKRAATVKAKEACKLWKLDRDSFNEIVKTAAQTGREKTVAFLKTVPILKGLDESQVSQLCDAVRLEHVPEDTFVVKQGDAGDTFCIIKEGPAKAIKDQDTVKQYEAGEFFGELALLKNAPRAASVLTTSKSSLLSIERKAFNRLLGSLDGLNSNKY
jgi:cAMP-dependent protein kinase regulator